MCSDGKLARKNFRSTRIGANSVERASGEIVVPGSILVQILIRMWTGDHELVYALLLMRFQ